MEIQILSQRREGAKDAWMALGRKTHEDLGVLASWREKTWGLSLEAQGIPLDAQCEGSKLIKEI